MPRVVFTTNLTEFFPAFLASPCKRLFGIVTRFDKLLSTLLVPLLSGTGSFLYPLATGLNMALSNPWLKAKTPL